MTCTVTYRKWKIQEDDEEQQRQHHAAAATHKIITDEVRLFNIISSTILIV